MVYQVSLHEVKSNLQKLLDPVKQGEEVVIVQAGVPIARLIPYANAKRRRVPGLLRDMIVGTDEPQ
ncbi:MAG: type II toxin-antitoxin system prevent-host-death family antitoxin [Armatimonadota bacterium]